jgi:CSLREA domain-containing protein
MIIRSTGAAQRRMSRIARMLAVLLCLGLPAVLTSRPVYAATLTVNISTDEADGECNTETSGTPDCSLRDAITAAAPGDTIVFSVPTVTLSNTLGTLTINKNLTITGDATNRTQIVAASGARIFTVASGLVEFNNLLLNGNFAGSGVSNAAGGAGAGLTMNNVRINNTAGGGAALGGAVYNTGTLTLNGAGFTVNGAGNGGSIANDVGGTLTIANADIGGSSAGTAGALLNRGTLIATTCLISGSSTTSGLGGGFLNESGNATFTNCTFSGNTAGGPPEAQRNGGGIAVTGGSVVLNSVTVGANTAQGSGGGISVSAGSLTMKATLVAANTSNDINGTIVSDGYNLIGNTAGTTITGVTTGNITGVNARIAGLAAIPGGTLATHALLPGSPAIDSVPAAECPANDQRGIVRAATSGASASSTPCDIGAFESRGFTVNASGGGQSTQVNTAFANPITVQISSASGEPTGSGALTFNGPASGASIIPRTGSVTAASNGVAEIDFLNANGIAGTYSVEIGGKGIAAPASVTLTNTPAPTPGYSSNPAPGSTIDVGAATVGSPVSTNISVSETGTADLVVSGATITGANAADFSVSPTSLTIPDGGTPQNLAITCTPSAADSRTATLSVTHNASGSPATYTLTCTGNLAPTPGYSSNPVPGSTVNVGAATVGSSTSTNIIINETGTADLTITNATVSGTNAADFSVSPTSLTIPDGGPSQNLTVTCTPSAPGSRTATLSVTHNASGSPATYTLTCTGSVTPTPSYSSNPAPGSTVNVGTATVGSPVSTSISVSETGTAALTITGATITGTNAADFSVSPTSLTIPDGGTPQNLTITCTPSAAGSRTATLSVTHNASGSPATYTLTCTGSLAPTPGYSSSPVPGSTINLGAAAIGSTLSASIVISETGTAALSITGATISGADAASFSVTPTSFTIPDGGASRSLAITCTPTGLGTRTATLTVVHNASGSPATYTLTCSSRGMFLPFVGN